MIRPRPVKPLVNLGAGKEDAENQPPPPPAAAKSWAGVVSTQVPVTKCFSGNQQQPPRLKFVADQMLTGLCTFSICISVKFVDSLVAFVCFILFLSNNSCSAAQMLEASGYDSVAMKPGDTRDKCVELCRRENRVVLSKGKAFEEVSELRPKEHLETTDCPVLMHFANVRQK